MTTETYSGKVTLDDIEVGNFGADWGRDDKPPRKLRGRQSKKAKARKQRFQRKARRRQRRR